MNVRTRCSVTSMHVSTFHSNQRPRTGVSKRRSSQLTVASGTGWHGPAQNAGQAKGTCGPAARSRGFGATPPDGCCPAGTIAAGTAGSRPPRPPTPHRQIPGCPDDDCCLAGARAQARRRASTRGQATGSGDGLGTYNDQPEMRTARKKRAVE